MNWRQLSNEIGNSRANWKNHRDVLRDIRKILEEVEIEPAQLCAVYKDQRLTERPCFNLPFRETQLVISAYSAKLRLTIIDRWQELEAFKNRVNITTLND